MSLFEDLLGRPGNGKAARDGVAPPSRSPAAERELLCRTIFPLSMIQREAAIDLEKLPSRPDSHTAGNDPEPLS